MSNQAESQGKGDAAMMTIVDSDDSIVIAEAAAKTVAGWEDLSSREQSEFVELTIAYRKRVEAAEMVLSTSEGGGKSVRVTGANDALAMLRLFCGLGTRSMAFMEYMLGTLIDYFSSTGRCTSGRINAGLAFVAGAQPTSEPEAALALQMFMANDAAQGAMRIFHKADMVPHMEIAGNLANKLMRTFAAQAEALAKMQRGGEQIVKHVHVDNRGGQAIVADTVVSGGARKNDGEQAHATDAVGIIATLPGADPFGNGVPIAGDEEREVQASRRTIDRRAEG
ncbi:MAG: hypothetical protein U5M50_11080 [Sphingobium sp.]|nr:hypothetical protein [Sphingobium sp.]